MLSNLFLNHFSMGSLKRYVNISELHLTLLDPMTTETFNPVHHFLSTLPSVRVLRSTGSTLDLLTRIQRRSPGDFTLLPSLRTLSLLQPSYLSGHWNKFVDAFIRSRHKSGHPLEVIDLTDWGNIRHFVKLHGVPGMKICIGKKTRKSVMNMFVSMVGEVSSMFY
ncbi:hypothetical protein CPB84DRAFT_1474956 [Gymnopilus junonius]|uniref:Uncharacterized protein n=1 Tax=Gymnopilus junonius TaxID=109634 RepID=A0A9P5NK31_GYMJU|nr:hypothetical protein CPB84DRAFT_1474956 [Gymnopilus junonius]